METYKKYNTGEWSEPYTFIKLLADGVLFGADKELNKLENIFYPLLKIISNEDNEIIEYQRDTKIKFIKSCDQSFLGEISIEEISLAAERHLDEIKKHYKGKGPYECPETEEFLDRINHKKLKSKSNDKRDITIVVHDMFTGRNPELGFSIKSKLGAPSTLFNAGFGTNFDYKINGNLSKEKIEIINSIEGTGKIIKRVQSIYENTAGLIYNSVGSEIFDCNLQVIDSSLPTIIANMLINCYKENKSKITDLIDILKKENPLNFNLKINEEFYDYKIKRFLLDSALGMTANNSWNGKFDATGGYIIVKEDGNLVCYHIYNFNEFQDYLMENTRFETASSSRYEFGKIYEKEGELYFRLNLQIRFT